MSHTYNFDKYKINLTLINLSLPESLTLNPQFTYSFSLILNLLAHSTTCGTYDFFEINQ